MSIFKRCISLLLVLVMVIYMVPAQAAAVGYRTVLEKSSELGDILEQTKKQEDDALVSAQTIPITVPEPEPIVEPETIPEPEIVLMDTEGNYTYTVSSNNTATITKYKGAETEVTIPDTLGGYSVVSIGTGAFKNCTHIQGVILPNSIQTIKTQAFSCCYNLREITFSENLQSIGKGAFESCTRLESVDIPDSVTSISSYAFVNCYALHTVELSKSLTTMYTYSFGNCDALTRITIPKTLNYCGTYTGIDQYDYGPFCACDNLREVTFEEGTTEISFGLFANCTGLESIVLPNTVTKIEEVAFQYCTNLQHITFSDNLISIDKAAFESCNSLRNIELPDSLTTIGVYAFVNCKKLESVKLSKNLKTMYTYSFGGCPALTSIEIPKSMDKCNSITYNEPYKYGAFCGCENLKTVTFEEGTTEIAYGLLANCGGLESITIPNTINKVENYAFMGCKNLNTIIFTGNAPTFDGSDVLSSVIANAYYPIDNASWTPNGMPYYDGNITWIPYADPNSIPLNGTYTSPQESVWYDIWCVGVSRFNAETNFTLNVGDDTYLTGDSRKARADIPFDLSEQVSITKDGWISCQIPQELVYTCREVVLYPDTQKNPFAQFVVARNTGDSMYVNLACSHLDVYENAMRTYDMYVDINWNGYTPGNIYLKQGDKTLDLREGKNQGLLLGMFSSSGGELRLCWETGEGTAHSQKLYLDIYKDSTSKIKLDGGESTFGTNKTGAEVDEMWGGLSFAIDLFNDTVPVELEMNPTSQNKGTFKGTIGIKIENADQKRTIIDLLDTNLNKNVDYTTFTSLKKSLEAKFPNTLIPQQANSFVISADTQFIGLVEGTYEIGSDGSLVSMEFTNSKILTSLDGKFSVSRQHYAFPIPWYWTLEIKAGAELALELQNEFDGSTGSIAPLNSDIELGLGAKAAVGWSGAASIGTKGGGSIHVDGQALPIDFSKTEVYADYSISLLYAEFGPFAYEGFKYESDKYYLWKDGKWVFNSDDSTSGGGGFRDSIPTNSFEMQQIPRDYINNVAYLMDAHNMLLNSIATIGAENLVKANTYTFTEPQIVQLDNGNLLLVWVDDPGVASRPENINRAALFYSVYDGSTWSEPAMVSDDKTADASPVLKNLNGNVYLLWTNANTVFNEAAEYEEYCASLDITYARFDAASGIFADVSVIDTNEYCDILPDIALVNGVPTVVWIQNSANDPFQTSGSNKLYAAHLESDNWDMEILADGLMTVDGLAATNNDNVLNVFISQDSDDDATTVEDRELFVVCDRSVTKFTDNEVADLKPAVIADSLYWYQSGKLTDGTQIIQLAEDTDRYVTAENGTDAAVLYQKSNEDDSVTICANILHDSTWSNEVELVTIDRYLQKYDAVMGDDGSITIITNEVELSDGIYGQATLCSYVFHPKCDIAVQQVCFNPLSMAPGGEVELFTTLKNTGTAESGDVYARIYDGEILLKEEILSIELDVGAEVTTILTYPLGEAFESESLRVEFWPVSGTDGNKNNNTADCAISCADVSVEELTAIQDNGTTQVSAYISNRGLAELSDVEVILYTKTGDEKNVIGSHTISSLAVAMGEPITFDTALEIDTVLYMEAVISDDELILSNNVELTLVTTASGVLGTASHNHVFSNYVSDGNATCTEDGTKTAKCDHCDLTDTIPDTGSALGHSFGNWNVIQHPTASEEGLEERICARCGYTEQRSIASLENPFTDVPAGSFFYDPVMWAVENGITSGTSATTFGPGDQCMRAHVVTFLWKAVGSPEPTKTSNPFVDVKPTDFFYKPVLWALENGITSGVDATHFGPASYCNRAQVITFLYQTKNRPAVDSTRNPFTDVPNGQWFTTPVLWAVENGITSGLSATSFGPGVVCNRAQIVTFLYKAFVNK